MSFISSRLWLALGALAFGAAMLASYEKPVRAEEPSTSPKAQRSGQELFQYWCATCHGKGPNMPGTTALGAKYMGELPAALEDRTDLTPEVVAYFVRNGVSIMPFFRKTEISDAELQEIGTYLARNNPDQ